MDIAGRHVLCGTYKDHREHLQEGRIAQIPAQVMGPSGPQNIVIQVEISTCKTKPGDCITVDKITGSPDATINQEALNAMIAQFKAQLKINCVEEEGPRLR